LKKKIVLLAAVLTLLLSAVMRIPFIWSVRAIIWTVDDDGPADFHTIQEAINIANPGDTIYVRNGTYYEYVVVNKTVAIIGESRHTTIINDYGSRIGGVVHVAADNAHITEFTIRPPGEEGGAGIYVTSSGNNMSHNIVEHFAFGIWLQGGSNNNVIAGNQALDNFDGFKIEYSNNNIIAGNQALDNVCGISVWHSNNNKFTENSVSNNEYGIRLYNSGNNTLMNNDCCNNEYNFVVDGDTFSHFDNYVDISNTVDGKPIYYVKGVTSKIYDAQTNAGTIYLINSENITIKDLTLTRNSRVFLRNTTNSKIQNVTAPNKLLEIRLEVSRNNILVSNDARGILLYESEYNTLTGNNVVTNKDGIKLEDYSNDNILVGNNVLASQGGIHAKYGISLGNHSNNNILIGNNVSFCDFGIRIYESSNNLIFHNNFVKNRKQFLIEPWYQSFNNAWDAGYPLGGNHWSDYTGEDSFSGLHQNENGSDGIGDIPYVINVDNQDHYPLMASYIPPAHMIVMYDDLLEKLNDLLYRYNLLNQTCSKLLGNMTDLQRKYDSLLDTINDMQEQINSLNSTLESKHKEIFNALNNIQNLMYVIVAISAVLIVVTGCLEMKTTQMKKRETRRAT